AFGDLDNDGDTDIVVTHNDGPPALLRNETAPQGHVLQVTLRAVGAGLGHRPVGARVSVRAGERSLTREGVGGTSYLSASHPRLLIGIGAAARADRLEVRWPSGRTDVWTSVPAGRPIELAEGEAPRVRPAP